MHHLTEQETGIVMDSQVLPYSLFARIYDEVMMEVEFEQWANFILSSVFIDELPNSILDLGCGTGKLLAFFPKQIPIKWGMDLSYTMLQKAKINCPEGEFFIGDIKRFSFKKKFDLIVSTHDTINYLLNKEDLIFHFQTIKKHLKKKGFYFFDICSEDNIVNNFDKKTIMEKHNDTVLVWNNHYSKKSKILESYLTFIINHGDTISEEQEIHFQKYYSPKEIQDILQVVGLKVDKIGGDYLHWQYPKEDCRLITFLVSHV